jgi:aldehyde:ferredoxin oxidoreductase
MYRLLRVDLSEGRASLEELDAAIQRQYIGGVGIGARILYDDVLPETSWDHEDNKVIFAAGPLNGTSIPGSGTICAVTKGCLTHGGASSQANAFFGAFIRSAGIYIHDGGVEIKDARFLLGKDTIETESLIVKALGEKRSRISVYSIGPAGENLVKYAMVAGDRGHVIAHNGFGAVLAAKKVKAVAVRNDGNKPYVKHPQALAELSKKMAIQAKNHPIYGKINKYGTSSLWPVLAKNGLVPVKNLTTNYFPKAYSFSREYYGPKYKMKRISCWACPFKHVQHIKITRGSDDPMYVKDPEYECSASWSSLIGNEDLEAAMMLSDLNDRLGMDSNEAGWVMSFAIECYERGIISHKDTDGIEMTWGNVDAVKKMLFKIAHREGIGDVLAEGVKKASEAIGGNALDIGVYVEKGHSPRTHDARARWGDILDYATGGVGTSESNAVPMEEPHRPASVARGVSKGKIREFVDSLVVCNIATMTYSGTNIRHLVDALNLVTDWDYSEQEAMDMAQRVTNLFRVFNLRCGHSPGQERPSIRYSSSPVDGPARGQNIAEQWEEILDAYYLEMGWDRTSGRPYPDILRRLGLGPLVDDIW